MGALGHSSSSSSPARSRDTFRDFSKAPSFSWRTECFSSMLRNILHILLPRYFLARLHLQHLSCFSFSWGKNTDGFWFCLEGLDLSVILCIFSDVNISWHLRYLEPLEVIYFECLVSGELSVCRNIYLLRMDELLPSRNSQKRTSFSYRKSCSQFGLGGNIRSFIKLWMFFFPKSLRNAKAARAVRGLCQLRLSLGLSRKQERI